MDLYASLAAALRAAKAQGLEAQDIAAKLEEATDRTRQTITESRKIIEQSERLLIPAPTGRARRGLAEKP